MDGGVVSAALTERGSSPRLIKVDVDDIVRWLRLELISKVKPTLQHLNGDEPGEPGQSSETVPSPWQ